MSKTFKSASSERILEVDRGAATVDLFIGKAGSFKCFEVNLADAPSIALAILEAAGWPEEDKSSATRPIMQDLRCVVEFDERKAKEAADREALEAEARTLWESQTELLGHFWHRLDEAENRRWITIARAARELHKAKS